MICISKVDPFFQFFFCSNCSGWIIGITQKNQVGDFFGQFRYKPIFFEAWHVNNALVITVSTASAGFAAHYGRIHINRVNRVADSNFAGASKYFLNISIVAF